MIKVIPERKEYFCDRCGDKNCGSTFSFDGSVSFSGRDSAGHFVGGVTRQIQMCDHCRYMFEQFMKVGKDERLQNKSR